jgi:5'-nucleotidase
MLTILISNDDGVDAPGIVALAQALWEIANVIVVAPNRDRSGSSHSLTLDRPLRPVKLANGYVSIDGTPSDCVHLAITGFLESAPDMVISGINSGANLGDDVLYSGTVAAAMEGRFLGYPSIAISSLGQEPQHYASAARVAVDLIKQIQKHPLPSSVILNVNVPALPYEELQGWKVTRLGQRHIAEPVIKQQDPRGRDVFWIGLPGGENYAGEDTDFYAVTHGYVSLTPLHADLTSYSAMAALEQWAQKEKL